MSTADEPACGSGRQPGSLWLSTRSLRRRGDPEWDDIQAFLGLDHVQELRTIDSWMNPCLEGNYSAADLEEVWNLLDQKLLPVPSSEREYYLVFTDALGPHGQLVHPRLRWLGCDLSDETWTSSLLNCGRWQGPLEPLARRTGPNGLLTLPDAQQAQALLPQAWPGNPHAQVTIWALYEVRTAPE